MANKKLSGRSRTHHERHFLGRRGRPPLLSEWWTKDKNGMIVSYGLAYIDFTRYASDNGRVLGYDNAHGFHERHFMGTAEQVEFTTYEAQVERFFLEVAEIRSKYGETDS